jgi:Flp pilus assembly protein TadB
MNIILFLFKGIIAVLAFFLIRSLIISKNLKTTAVVNIEKNKFLNNMINRKIFSKIKSDFMKLGIVFNPIILAAFILVGFFVASVVYSISLKIFEIKSVAVIIAIPFTLAGFFIVRAISIKKQERLEMVMNDFFIQLKGALRVNSDIIEAFRKIQSNVLSPFGVYLTQMLKEINAGVIPEEALIKFAHKVDIKKFSFYINNLRYASIYGGDVISLTVETQKSISDILKQKRKRQKETKSICTVLYILILIDLFIYFAFIVKDPNYLSLMRNNSIGNLVLTINFLSIWLIIWFSNIMRNLDF